MSEPVWNAKLSSLITSMMGHTTIVLQRDIKQKEGVRVMEVTIKFVVK